jgi:N-acetylmuramoyl-L-alanine amidase
MQVLSDHFLETAIREVIPGGSPMNIRRFLVIHFTSGATAKSSINFWRSKEANGASAHIVIDRDGTLYQCRQFNVTCGHAGRSEWKGFESLNSCSIGIELANAGDDSKLASKYTKLPLVKASHKNGSTTKEWEAYPEEQLKVCVDVSRAIVARYNLDDVVGHEDIAPNRKNDPGPAFPMQRLREACGFNGLPSK